MHYNDFKKYKDFGGYHIVCNLIEFYNWIHERKCDYGLQVQPVFQRKIVWTINQQREYLEHILSGGYWGRQFFFNHPGWMTTFEGDFFLVDGLQRVTAIEKFIENRIKVFGHYFNQINGSPTQQIEVFVNNLPFYVDVLEWYIQLNTAGVPHTKAEINRVKNILKKEKENGKTNTRGN